MPSELRNDLFLRACRRQSVERTPIWIMRQAGRYLPEYRELRARFDFLTACRTPEIASEITLQPVLRLGVDAAILFSDILIPLPGMGINVEFDPAPRIDAPLRSRSAIEALRVPEAREATPFVMDAIRLVLERLEGSVPLIGFAGAPFTVATYLVEGGGSKSFAAIKTLLYSEPDLAHLLLSKCADTIASYLSEQVRAGAQAAMLFDTWAGILSPEDYQSFAAPYARRVFESLANAVPDPEPGISGRGVPRIYYAGESAGHLEMLKTLGATVIGLDWRLGLDAARRRIGNELALQGNLDPAVLLGSPEMIERHAARVLSEAKGDVPIGRTDHANADASLEEGRVGISADSSGRRREPRAIAGPAVGHIFNLGHGILPQTPPENALFLVEAVRRLTSIDSAGSR